MADSVSRVGRVAHVKYVGGVTGEVPVDVHEDEALEVVLGVGGLPRGIDHAFMEMEIGEKRTVVIPPEDGFGFHDPQGVATYPRVFIEGGERLKRGDVFAWTNPVSERPIPVKCVDADESSVVIDFNHPLAGKQLTYSLELVSVE